DGFADPLPGGVPNSIFHQVAQNDAVGVLVEDLFVDALGVVVKGRRVFAVFFELPPLFLGQLRVLDSFPKEACRMGRDLVRDQVVLLDGFIEVVIESRVLIPAVEKLEAVSCDELDWRSGQAYLEAVKVSKEIAVMVVDAPVGFVGDQEIEEARIEVLEESV